MRRGTGSGVRAGERFDVSDDIDGRETGSGGAGAGGGTGTGADRDRRRFPRLAKSCHIRVRALAGMENADTGLDAVTVNISGGGLCYESPEARPVGSFLAVELRMSELESPVLALARAVFCSSQGPPFEVGLEFWWVGWGDDSAQRAISDLIKTELRQQDQG